MIGDYSRKGTERTAMERLVVRMIGMLGASLPAVALMPCAATAPTPAPSRSGCSSS
jgi:hypothetical protein